MFLILPHSNSWSFFLPALGPFAFSLSPTNHQSPTGCSSSGTTWPSPPACPPFTSALQISEMGFWSRQKVLSWGSAPPLTVLSLQTKEALLKILSDLRPGDYFDLVLFGSQVQSWKGFLVQASAANVQSAKDFVRRFALAGGKVMHLKPPWCHLYLLRMKAYTCLLSVLCSHKPKWRFAPGN